ncbi:MAG TPA: CrcB family protein [Marmoricola sp.]|nr:CrcB family protein [Marmoricola sp.]
MTVLYVALGAALGAPLRFLVAHRLDGHLPWGTVLVNVAGSFLLGVLSALGLGVEAAALLGTGFCGALTTYSAFAVQAHERGLRDGLLVVVLTVPPALAACILGHALAAG